MTREASQPWQSADDECEEATCEAPLMLPRGTVVADRFRIVRVLGAGAMGVVYLADRTNGDGQVALKLVHSSEVGSSGLRARLRREATMLGRIHHPNVVRLLEHGSAGEYGPYVASEYLEGESLAARLSIARQLPPDLAVWFAEDILLGLAATHEAGIVHRDLKPGNILLVKCTDPGGKGVERERAKILDFGVSRMENLRGSAEFPTITRTGAIVGTPAFMAPEQAVGDPAQDHRVDLYSLGVLLYKMLSGALPHQGRNYNHALVHAMTAEPTPLREVAPHIDTELSAIVHRAIARIPSARFATASEFGAALAHWRETLTRIDLTARFTAVSADAVQTARGFWSKRGRVISLALLTAAIGVTAAVSRGRMSPRPHDHVSQEVVVSAPSPASAAPEKPLPTPVAIAPTPPPRPEPLAPPPTLVVAPQAVDAASAPREAPSDRPRGHSSRGRHRRLRILTVDPYARSATPARSPR